MKYPLGIAVLFYVAGLVLAEYFQLSLAVLLGISLAAAAFAIFISRVRGFLIWPLVVLTAWTNSVFHTAIISPQDLRTILDGEPVQVVVRGSLSITPELSVASFGGVERIHTRARVSVTEIQIANAWKPAFGDLEVFAPSKLSPEFFLGQRVEISGIIARPNPPFIEGRFDYQKYLRRQGVYFRLSTGRYDTWKIIEPGLIQPPLTEKFIAWAQKTLALGLPKQDEPLRLLWSMVLGWRNALPDEFYKPFTHAGTMHIFAISGLHIALIAGILVALLRTVRISRIWCGIVVIPLIWFYTGATGWQPSAIRSTIMMTIIVGGWALKRPGNLLNSLAAAGLVILLWQPQQLFQAGFQLSFFVVLSIALFQPPLEKFRDWLLKTDPLLPPELLSPKKRAWHWALRWVLSTVSVSLAAWLGSWPLTAYYFQLFSPVTLLANVLVVPISGFALAASIGSLLVGAWLPFLSELFNHSAWFLMSCMMKISHWATELPWAFWKVRRIQIADFFIYYGILFALLSGWILKKRRWIWIAPVLIIFAGFYNWRIVTARNSAILTVMPLNGGNSVFCDLSGSQNDMLMDCGNANAVENIVEPFLSANGVNSLSRLLLTHGDLQHVGGVEPLRAEIPIKEIITSNFRFRSSGYRRIIRSNEISHVVSRGDIISGWQVLHPEKEDSFSQADDASVVLYGEIYGTRVLLLSDLGKPGQNALLDRNPELPADIVISGIPEESEPLSDALLAATKPKLVVVVDSKYPAPKKATPRLRDRLQRHLIPVIYTADTGAATITLNKKGWNLKITGSKISSDALPIIEPRIVEPMTNTDLELPDEK
jgi:competence protein ComEC